MASYRHSGYLASAGVAAVMALSAEPGKAQSNAELMDIIRQQQRQIEQLSLKVEALEGQAQQASEKADTAAATVHKAEQEAPDIEVEWAPGPTFSSKDGSWSVQVLGRLQVDGGALGDEDDFYKNDNAAELRRARLGAEGNFYQGWKYKFETDFADGTVDVKDAYLEYGGEFVEPAYVRVGQYKTPNALEQVGSDLFTTFMEKAAIIDAFELDYQIGLGGGASGENWGVDGGLFGQNASDQQDNEGYALAGRGHYAFFRDPEDRGENSSEWSTWAARCATATSTMTPSTVRPATASGRSSTSPARAAWIPGWSTIPKATSGPARSSRGSRARSRCRASSRTPRCSASMARTMPTTCGAAISGPAIS
jgi:phosphate-selective porin